MFCIHVCKCTSVVQYPQRSEESAGFSETGPMAALERWLLIIIWVLGIKPGSFGKAAEPSL